MTTPQLSSPDFALLTAPPILYPRGQYLSICPRTTVFAGQIVGDPFADFQTLGLWGFPYGFVTTGVYTDVQQHQSVDFGTMPGANDIGTARVRYVPDTGLFHINEIAPARLRIANGVYFTVRDEYRPALRLPLGRAAQVNASYTNSVQMFVDYGQSYSNQNKVFAGKANITRSASLKLAPKPAGFVDSFHTASPGNVRTMTFSAFWSFSPSGTRVSQVWDLVDGSYIVGTSTSRDITARFPVGFRYIKLTVTFSDGGVAIMRFPIWVHDATHLPLSRFRLDRNWTGDWRELDLVFSQQDASEQVVPKGAPMCCWEDDPLWGTTVPDQYRDQVYGWSKDQVTLFRKDQSTTTITLTGMAEWFDRYRSIPQRVQDPLTRDPQTWFEMRNIALEKLLFYMQENFSTANLISNLFVPGVTDILKSLDITGKSMFDQERYIMQGNYNRVRCRSLNDIVVEKNPQYMNATERTFVAPTVSLDSRHWPDGSAPKVTVRGYDLVARVAGSGASFDGTTSTIYNSSAPGRTPADSNTEQDAPGQNLPNVTPQDVLNQLTGAHWKVLNNDRDNVPLDLLHNLDVLEPGDLIALTTDDSDDGVTLNGDLFMVDEVSITYDDPYAGRGKKINLKLEGLVDAATAQDAQFVIVPPDPVVPPDEQPPIDIIIPPTTVTGIPPYNGIDQVPTKLIVFDSGGAHCHVATLWNPALSTLSYTDVSSGLTGFNIWSTADPFNYRRYYALQSTGLYKNENPFGGGTWTLVANNATLFGSSGRIGKMIAMSINRQGYIAILSGTYFVYSPDYGVTWHQVAILGGSSAYQTSLNDLSMFAISPYNNGANGVIFFNTPAVNDTLYVSTDWGATWATVITGRAFMGPPHLPYIRSDGSTPNENNSGQEIYTARAGTNTYAILLSQDEGNSFNNQRFINSAGAYWIPGYSTFTGWMIMTFTWDGRRISFGGTDNFSGTAWKVFISNDAGVTGSEFSFPVSGGVQFLNFVNRYPVHKSAHLFWARNNTKLHWTLDDGATMGDADVPAGYAGASYTEWNIADV